MEKTESKRPAKRTKQSSKDKLAIRLSKLIQDEDIIMVKLEKIHLQTFLTYQYRHSGKKVEELVEL